MMNREFLCKAVKRHSNFMTPPSLLFIFSDYSLSFRQAMIDESDLDGVLKSRLDRFRTSKTLKGGGS